MLDVLRLILRVTTSMKDACPQLAQPHPWLKQTSASRAVVLLYHRVSEFESDPQLLCVTPGHFEEHLAVLKTGSYTLLTIGNLVEHLRSGTLPKRTVVITFDDGYADNMVARELLEKHDIPATVFVTAGTVGTGCGFWWDELDQLLLHPGPLPPILELNIGSVQTKAKLTDSLLYTQDQAAAYAEWSVADDGSPTERHEIYRAFHAQLKAASPHSRDLALSQLFKQCHRDRASMPFAKGLSEGELSELGRNGIIEIGSHTMTHPVLASLSVPDQFAEISSSKQKLESIIGRPIQSFAYPYGSRNDFTKATVEIVQEAGYQSGCANVPDLVWAGSDRFQLPRVLMRNYNGEVFSDWLDQWF